MASVPLTPTVARNKQANHKSLLLYKRCLAAKDVGSEFTIVELEAFDIASNAEELRLLCQDLLDLQTFVVLTRNRTPVYRTRPANVAAKLVKLEPDVLIIYNTIAGAGRTGIWKKNLSEKANLHDNTVIKAVKELMSKSLIKEFKTAKNATKRMYILFELQPSEDSTGGTFYDEGELDEALVHALSDFTRTEIEERSWAVQAQPANSGSKKPPPPPPGPEYSSIYPEHRLQIPRNLDGHVLVPHPYTFEAYPTAEEIWTVVRDSGLVKDMDFPLQAAQRLINVLIYDGQVMEILPGRYATVRRVETDPVSFLRNPPGFGFQDVDVHGFGVSTGLSGVPCDRCPVSKDCRPGARVSPENCKYMDRWLERLQF